MCMHLCIFEICPFGAAHGRGLHFQSCFCMPAGRPKHKRPWALGIACMHRAFAGPRPRYLSLLHAFRTVVYDSHTTSVQPLWMKICEACLPSMCLVQAMNVGYVSIFRCSVHSARVHIQMLSAHMDVGTYVRMLSVWC